ncbi:MAG: toxin-antitoxin (TA) system antitoxin [Oscillatoriales cyanobacterium SM2_1_8]|nr:toxin-antitoxin (TA) system antitoxin [Oscillatoriales cyanobacterium SM2_1_8]
MLKQIDVGEVGERFSELLAQLAEGDEWLLIDGTTPVARLVPIATRVAALHPGAIWLSPDFDEPLPDEVWAGQG